MSLEYEFEINVFDRLKVKLPKLQTDRIKVIYEITPEQYDEVLYMFYATLSGQSYEQAKEELEQDPEHAEDLGYDYEDEITEAIIQRYSPLVNSMFFDDMASIYLDKK